MVSPFEKAQANYNGFESHSPKYSWEQIETQEEITRIIQRIQGAKSFEVYKCATLYDLAYPGYPGDKDYYLEKGSKGKVLYLGVGTGRIFADLAKFNPNAVGLDLSSEMLELLIRKNPLIHKDQLIEANALTANLESNQFDTILAPYSFLQCIGNDENVVQLLRNVSKWLRPGGKFYTDTFSPYLIPFTKKGLESSVRSIPDKVRVTIYVFYDHFNQKMKELALIEQRGETDRVLEMDLNYFFPHELTALFKQAGLEIQKITGGYKGENFDPSENEIIVFEAAKKEIEYSSDENDNIYRAVPFKDAHLRPFSSTVQPL